MRYVIVGVVNHDFSRVKYAFCHCGLNVRIISFLIAICGQPTFLVLLFILRSQRIS